MPLHTGSAAIAGDNAGPIAEINENRSVNIAISRQAEADADRAPRRLDFFSEGTLICNRFDPNPL
ncbi:MAG: hypothetical protein ABIY38_10220, partial [Rhodococcus sp. (in: high G+C Gram-positive bacteria)]